MSLNGSYDPDNIFAKILRGDMPCAKVYEDEQVLAFMDAFPQTRGHVLVVPREPARNLLELTDGALQGAMLRVKWIAEAVRKALDPDGIVMTQFSGAPAGQSVFHVHFHIIPRMEGDVMTGHGNGMADMEELQALAAQIAAKIELP